ncbi:arylacetamide deacetylase-like [Saccostrea echinata]|uniref:arylacetamide deacetylase-like n=1 Tax=Saccostrea echinata TaxID=191078 RepID=UPI002A7F714E|nr:arylacetamide deacetylase-like [Saccostrea echinata]
MDKYKFLLVILSAALVGLAYHLYTPMPPEAEEPYQQMAFLAKFKLVMGFVSLLDVLGIGDGVSTYRKLRSIKPVIDPNDTVTSVDDTFDGVYVRVYSPKNHPKDKLLPGLVFYHGGGWVFGSRDSHDPMMRRFVRRKQMVVVSVEYRLAPEFPFPAPIDDCVSATSHFLRHAKKYRTDPNRIGVMGDSAGGNLAAAVALRLLGPNFTHLPKIKVQVLIYPALQAFQFATPAYVKYAGTSVPGLLNSERMAEFWLRYAFGHEFLTVNHLDLLAGRHLTSEWLASEEARHVNIQNLPQELRVGDFSATSNTEKNVTLSNFIKPVFLNPSFAPLMADDRSVGQLPSTYILTAEFDPLRDDGFYMTKRLQTMKKKVEHRHFTGMDHGFLSIQNYKNSLKAVEEICEYLNKEL